MRHKLLLLAVLALAAVSVAQVRPVPVPATSSPGAAIVTSSTQPGAAGLLLRRLPAAGSEPERFSVCWPGEDGGWECAANARTTPNGAGGGVDVTADFILAPRTRHCVLAPVPGVSAEHLCGLTPSFYPDGGTGLVRPLGLVLAAEPRPATQEVLVCFENPAESTSVVVPAGHYHINCSLSPVTATVSALTDGGTP